jgi:hypothetical protein
LKFARQTPERGIRIRIDDPTRAVNLTEIEPVSRAIRVRDGKYESTLQDTVRERLFVVNAPERPVQDVNLKRRNFELRRDRLPHITDLTRNFEIAQRSGFQGATGTTDRARPYRPRHIEPRAVDTQFAVRNAVEIPHPLRHHVITSCKVEFIPQHSVVKCEARAAVRDRRITRELQAVFAIADRDGDGDFRVRPRRGGRAREGSVVTNEIRNPTTPGGERDVAEPIFEGFASPLDQGREIENGAGARNQKTAGINCHNSD